MAMSMQHGKTITDLRVDHGDQALTLHWLRCRQMTAPIAKVLPASAWMLTRFPTGSRRVHNPETPISASLRCGVVHQERAIFFNV